MIAQVTGDAVRFRDLVFPLLRRDPVLNTVLLTGIESRARGDVVDPEAPTYVSVHDGVEVVGAAMRTATHGIFLGALTPDYASATADALAATAPDTPTVEGLEPTARAFAGRWRTLLGVETRETVGTRLHLLADLRAAVADGRARPATGDDVALLVEWVTAFGAETGHPREVPVPVVRAWVDSERAWLWTQDGRPVCLAAHQVPCFGVARIGPVYTPPEQRGRGHASALTGHVAGRLQRTGLRVCLYTQRDNPTSNHIYAALGFEPVADFSTYAFG